MKRRGFTLVELAIVIAILGILAMYAIPKYQGMVDEARSAQARAQLGTFRSALAIYYAKNSGKFPSLTDVQNGTIFAEGTVPTVEITYGASHTPVKNNTVKNGGTTVPIQSTSISSDPSADGCWIYAVTGDYTQADVRLNSTDTDPANPTKYWYQY